MVAAYIALIWVCTASAVAKTVSADVLGDRGAIAEKLKMKAGVAGGTVPIVATAST
jgi:hypothetical protein